MLHAQHLYMSAAGRVDLSAMSYKLQIFRRRSDGDAASLPLKSLMSH